jgi:6,7-dimethyl-8-ribityllumazine synthase
MATAGKNLSQYSKEEILNSADFKIGIVVSIWNDEITSNLLSGALQALKDFGVLDENIIIKQVPGAFELPLGSQYLLSAADVDGVIAIGVVIQGETKHFDFVCSGATQGIMEVMLKFDKPVAYCLLTDNHIQQSIDRSGGIHGNKGIEAAIACLKMISLKKSLL